MQRVPEVSVLVDGKPVPATVYLGQPTLYESDAYTLVVMPGVGRYMVDFDDESYREVSSFEYLQLGLGVWTLRSMQAGHFSKLLPFLHLDEFRIPASGGRVVTFVFS